ncbi:MAG: hypothetical protein IT357_02940 [Gemmatimonadaceae bacterium]|nr:hypothetical protein [Gemmatimonadaceae bacterium]
MTPSTVLLSSALTPLFAALLSAAPTATVVPNHPTAPAKLQFTLQTVHAAALTKARAQGDAKDEPYLLLSVAGPGASVTAMPFPATESMSIKFDEALPARALHTLSLEDGESVRVVLSALEGPRGSAVMESEAATLAAGIVRQASDKRADALTFALKPLTDTGANLLGAAILVVTNEGGTLYWRALECVTTCSVLTEPTAAALQGNATNQGVLELTGAEGTYHFNLIGRRLP